MQWEVVIPPDSLDLEYTPSARAPLAVKDAGKSLNCAVSRNPEKPFLVPCILAGSHKPIPNGTIVLLSLKLGARARPGPVPIRLQNPMAFTSDLKPVSIALGEGVLTIRAR